MFDALVLRTPGDTVAAVPSLLGFHPHDSLVALWTGPTGSLVCTVRLDLDTPPAEVARRLLDLASRVEQGQFLLIAYPVRLTAWIDSSTECDVLGVAEAIRAAGVPVRDLLVVADGRYWSMLCTDPGCCPPGGRPVPDATTELEAQRVRAGHLAVARSREQVAARYQLRPDQQPAPDLIEAATSSVPATLAEAVKRAWALLHSATAAHATARAEAMVLLQDVHVRDYVIARLALDPGDQVGLDELITLALSAPDALRPRLAGAAAAVAYAVAESPVAVWSLLEHASHDSLAQLVATGIDICTPPHVLVEVFTDALTDLEERIRTEPDVA